jgi:hypothetical protein
MSDTNKKETITPKEPQQKEISQTGDRPISIIKGLFRDTSFIVEEAKRMAQDSK